MKAWIKIKLNMMKRASELYRQKMDTPIDPISFDVTNSKKFVSIPGKRLQAKTKWTFGDSVS